MKTNALLFSLLMATFPVFAVAEEENPTQPTSATTVNNLERPSITPDEYLEERWENVKNWKPQKGKNPSSNAENTPPAYPVPEYLLKPEDIDDKLYRNKLNAWKEKQKNKQKPSQVKPPTTTNPGANEEPEKKDKKDVSSDISSTIERALFPERDSWPNANPDDKELALQEGEGFPEEGEGFPEDGFPKGFPAEGFPRQQS